MEKNRSALQKSLIAAVRLYQKVISPLFPAKCRFYPSCSSYTITAIECHGSIKGGWLSLKRILKCQPFSKGGFDPVPNSPLSNIENKEK